MNLHFDREGKPLDVMAWAELFEDANYHRVGLDVSPSLEVMASDPLRSEPVATISTVWMGIDHSFGRGAPLIFETMVFGGGYDQECMRYSTEAQALEGHARVVADLQEGRAPWWLADRMSGSAEGDE